MVESKANGWVLYVHGFHCRDKELLWEIRKETRP